MKVFKRDVGQLCSRAPLFAALGDETRLTLLMKLGDGQPKSISQLSQGESVSRQAITKHLQVLNEVGLVKGVRKGREKLFQVEQKPLDDLRLALDLISKQWDHALDRLKSHVEQA
ncbi:ArsR/SmtB family transcription factor [Gimesia sp.]|uniref:ArsR/SmtB family transcription factor n=1 Tax=Gimesia sp. TaxID=2024833 RepID=UPI003A90E5D7